LRKNIPSSILGLKSEEEIEYEIALAKYKNKFLLFRIFTRKPILKQPEIFNCRCSSLDDENDWGPKVG
jgi:hypothetical protein